MIESLKIADVKTEGMQTRAAMSEDVVAEYAESMKAGTQFPPIVVFDDGEFYWLADGFHRLEAATRAGSKKIEADIREGERHDALRYALSSNTGHGLRRTNADKKRAVMVAYENRNALGLGESPSARAIAEVVGVSDIFVTSQLQTVCSWVNATARTGADGKTRSLPPPRPKKVEEKATEPSTPSYEQQAGRSDRTPPPPPPSRPVPPPPPKKPEAVKVYDNIGKIVPPNLVELWNKREVVSETAKMVRAARLVIKKAEDKKDPVWAGLNFSSTMMHLDNVLAQVEGSVPHCVCLFCQGLGCKACSGVGIMTEFQYKNAPGDMKK